MELSRAESSKISGPIGAPEIGDGLSIREVSRMLSVPAPTIRSWERRYGVPVTPRSAGGHRRYSTAEVVTLRRMRDEIARGRRAADAALMVHAAEEPAEPYRSHIGGFLRAIETRDAPALCTALELARDQLGAEEAIMGVLMPAMREVGAWWAAGRCDIGAEQMATDAARSWLHSLYQLAPPPWRAGVVILACGPRDQHTLGQEAMRVLLARRGLATRLLGARTPAEALAAAIRSIGASAVVVVSHLSVGRRAAIESLRTAERTGAQVFYAGNSFIAQPARAGVPGAYLGENLLSAADAVTRALEPASPSAPQLNGLRLPALS